MIDLYSVPTANGQRVHIMLEETGLPYEPHCVNLRGGEHLEKSFLDKNPFGRVPAIVDNDGPNGEPISIFEGHAILAYLAEKSGQLYPDDLGVRTQINIWMSAVSANLAPAFAAQFWFTTLAPERSDMAIERYISEVHRGLRALDLLLSNHDYIAGSEYTIADIHAYPVAATSGARLDGALTPYPNIRGWSETIRKREAVKRGMALFTDAG